MIHITAHAIQRYQQRVADLPAEAVRALIDTPAVRLAAKFAGNAEIHVTLPTGHRIIVVDATVVTVTPSSHYKRRRAKELDE
jgi:hypothetical protein